MNKKYMIGLISIVFTTIFWGISFTSIKVSLTVLTPMNLAALRFIIASGFLSIVYLFGVKDKRLEKKDIKIFAITGLLGFTLYFYFQNNGIKYISSSSASLIVAGIPVITLIADVLIFKLKLEKKHLVSVVLSFLGVYFIVKNAPTGGNSIKGFVMMGGSAIVWVAYTVLSRPLQERYDTISVIYFQTIMGSLFLLPFLFIEGIPFSDLTLTITLNVLYLGTMSSAVGYFLYLKALNNLGLTVSAMFLNLIPVVTVVCSYFVLKETIGYYQLIGGIMVIMAVCIINYKKGSEELEN